MRTRRWMLIAAVGGTLAGCATTDPLNNDQNGVGYRSVTVGSGEAGAFYYLPEDDWTALAADDGARMAAMLGDHTFSAVKANGPVKMRLGIRYHVIPVCGGQPRPDHAIRPVITDQKVVTVGC
jgi:hypothetical protein